ncbi:hypothetical protein LUZ60_007115 [Juncus effusus]|nr:hypothetical protein LUZ60_007115 [Juncus effusus]
MDEGDLDFSNPDVFPGGHVSIEDPPTSCSMDSFFDEILQDNTHHACTHTHTCNPPGRDLSHTHTCFHVHTKILSQSSDSEKSSNPNPNSKKRPCGNREAVRKYREKKKAHTASLEDEVLQLRVMNQQLMRKLQAQSSLEAEVARLRCLLVDIRGRIEGEIGNFPYQKPDLGVNSCDFRCDDQMYCPKQGGKTVIMPNNGVGNSNTNNNNGFGVCSGSGLGNKKFVNCDNGDLLPFGCSEQK